MPPHPERNEEPQLPHAVRERFDVEGSSALSTYVRDVVDWRLERALERTEDQFVRHVRQELAPVRAEWRQELAAARGDWRQELAVFRAEIRQELQTFKAEIRQEFATKAEFATFRGEMRQEFATFRTELHEEFAIFKADMRQELVSGLANQRADLMKWMFTFWIGQATVTVGLILAIT